MHSHLHKSSAFLMLVQANSAILFFKVAFVSSVQGKRAVVKKVLKSVVMSLNFVVESLLSFRESSLWWIFSMLHDLQLNEYLYMVWVSVGMGRHSGFRQCRILCKEVA